MMMKKEGTRSDKTYKCIGDVDAEIKRLKQPPCKLSWDDFKDQYNLPYEGDNPHHFH